MKFISHQSCYLYTLLTQFLLFFVELLIFLLFFFFFSLFHFSSYYNFFFRRVNCWKTRNRIVKQSLSPRSQKLITNYLIFERRYAGRPQKYWMWVLKMITCSTLDILKIIQRGANVKNYEMELFCASKQMRMMTFLKELSTNSLVNSKKNFSKLLKFLKDLFYGWMEIPKW